MTCRVTGPLYDNTGLIFWRNHDCTHRGEGQECPEQRRAYAGHCVAAISEGYCPWHLNCRLTPDPIPGATAAGRCPRTGYRWSVTPGWDGDVAFAIDYAPDDPWWQARRDPSPPASRWW